MLSYFSHVTEIAQQVIPFNEQNMYFGARSIQYRQQSPGRTPRHALLITLKVHLRTNFFFFSSQGPITQGRKSVADEIRTRAHFLFARRNNLGGWNSSNKLFLLTNIYIYFGARSIQYRQQSPGRTSRHVPLKSRSTSGPLFSSHKDLPGIIQAR